MHCSRSPQFGHLIAKKIPSAVTVAFGYSRTEPSELIRQLRTISHSALHISQRTMIGSAITELARDDRSKPPAANWTFGPPRL